MSRRGRPAGSTGNAGSGDRPAGSNEGKTMAIGPVQLIVLGFTHPKFHGEIIAELERLRESDTVRVIDALGGLQGRGRGDRGRAPEQPLHRRGDRAGQQDRRPDRPGRRGRGGDGGRRGGRGGGGGGRGARVHRRGRLGRARGHPERLGRRADPAGAPLGGAAARRDRAGPAASGSATGSSARWTSSRSGCSRPRRPRSCTSWKPPTPQADRSPTRSAITTTKQRPSRQPGGRDVRRTQGRSAYWQADREARVTPELGRSSVVRRGRAGSRVAARQAHRRPEYGGGV